MDENEFRDLYTQEYRNFIESFYPKLIEVRDNFPQFLDFQIVNYESIIINQADDIVIETIIKHNINLSDIFGQQYEQKFMLDKITRKCWSIQSVIRRNTFDAFISDVLQKTEHD
jgi:hypothetical protein